MGKYKIIADHGSRQIKHAWCCVFGGLWRMELLGGRVDVSGETNSSPTLRSYEKGDGQEKGIHTL
jgi:hypothetical protein